MVWLFKEAWNIRKNAECGKSGDVQREMVHSWKERLPELVQKY